MKIIFTILLTFSNVLIYAQINLVPNNSFEVYTDCPTVNNQLSLTPNWYSPTLGNPEYYNFCGTPSWSVPSNVSGFEYAYDGKAYIGFYTFYDTCNSSEYVQVRLIDTLQSNQVYHVEFFLSLADNSGLATTLIGAYLSDTAIGNNDYSSLHFTPQIVSTTIAQVSLKNGWSKIYGTYTAHGGENYITLGKFYPNPATDAVPVSGGTWSCCSYYYIDDIYVGLDTTVNIKEQAGSDFNFKIYPNPSNGEIQLNYSIPEGEEGKIEFYNILGVKVKDIPLSGTCSKVIELDIPTGLYNYQFIVSNKIVTYGKQLILK